ncbi:pleckstriny domain family B member 1 [Biomphalaria glabrata]|nr:pleckstriny domain family B member 1 [Biomphalaria glabrata]
MLCLGRSNYFRFNHPQEAEMLRDPNYNYRISNIVPNFVPGQSLITKPTVTITLLSVASLLYTVNRATKSHHNVGPSIMTTP